MNPWKVKWDLFIICMAIYSCIALPLEVAIVPPFMVKDGHLARTNVFIDLAYLMDVVLSFRTSYINQMTGDEITTPREITKNYLLGRFTVDFISVVPFDRIFSMTGDNFFANNERKFALISCLKLFRILRLSRIINYLKSGEEVKI